MKDLPPHTLEEHRDYLHKIVHLKLFFLHQWLEEHPTETFREVIRTRVDIYRKTNANPQTLNPSECFFDAAPWMTMENAAYECYRQNQNNRAAFEQQAFEVFRPSLDARCERDFRDQARLAHYQCGSLRYETALSNDGVTVGFHIANAICPNSIFEDPAYLPQCFARLLDAVEAMGARKIATSTWLNANLHWLSLFPPEWINHLSGPNTNVQWHYGFWGQFISARHGFNEKHGNYLRTTGEFPFYPRYSTCGTESMRKSIARFL